MSVSQRFLSVVVLLMVCACGATATGPERAPENVLFVGNSFTYYNNSLHNHYRALLRSARPDLASSGTVRAMTISGGRLPEHRAGLGPMLASQEWDVVVLQGHSLGPIGDETAEPFRGAAREYAAMIRERGAEPVFFMTWAYSDRPEMTSLLNAAYTGIGEELGARVAPVGLAFATVTRERPELDLRTADQRHPSLAGTYLAACTFYAVLQRRSPVGIEYDAGLGEGVAAYLQDVARRAVQEYAER